MVNRHPRLVHGAPVALIAAIVLLLSLKPASAQDVLAQARALHSAGKSAEALKVLETRLESNPTDTDARGLYGTMLSWDGRYAEARVELERVVAVSPDNPDATLALINVELWAGNTQKAEELVTSALRRKPGNTRLLLAQARVLRSLNRREESKQTLDHVLQTDPDQTEARMMRQSLVENSDNWEVSVEHSSEWLSDGESPWQESTFSLKRATAAGPILVNFSRAERFDLASSQFTLEFYPRIRQGTWAYVEMGFSNDHTLYPHTLFGGDLYQTVGHGFEVSMGYRRLNFADPVNIYTPTLNKYYRNWLFTARVFLTPSSTGTSKSVQFIPRRYFRDGVSYVGLRIGRGSSPLETQIVTDTEVLYNATYIGELYKRLGRRWALNVRSGMSQEDRLQRSGLNHYIADVSLYFRF